jgi:hypothetical protein
LGKRVAQHQQKEEEADEAHQEHEEGVETEFGEDEVSCAGYGIKIEEPSTTFIKEAFGDGVDGDEQLDHPEETFPNLSFGLAHSEVQYENGRGYIEEYAIECILLTNFEQKVLFKECPYVSDASDGSKFCGKCTVKDNFNNSINGRVSSACRVVITVAAAGFVAIFFA